MVLIVTIDTQSETTAVHPLVAREEWRDLSSTYLYTGAQAPALKSVVAAVSDAIGAQSKGPAGREQLQALELAGQVEIARVLGCSSDDIAFTGDASTAWNLVAGGLSWEPGDNIVVNVLEHPSVFYPFLRLSDHGLDVRFVDHDGTWEITAESIERFIDDRTRAVAISDVAYVNGVRNDVAAIAAVADSHGIPLLVDWSHSLGVLPVDASQCAIGISASYKWSLGPYGVGIVFWNRDRLADFVPGAVGWRSTPDFDNDERFTRITLEESAARFRLGGPSFAGIAGVTAGLRRLGALDPAAIADHALTLTGEAHRALSDAGFDLMSPAAVGRRSGNIAIRIERSTEVGAALARRGVLLWAGDGRLRASFHVMNDRGDVDALVGALIEVRDELGIAPSAT